MFRLRVRVSLAVLYILFLKRRWFLCLLTLKLKIIFTGSRSSEVEYLVEAQGSKAQNFPGALWSVGSIGTAAVLKTAIPKGY